MPPKLQPSHGLCDTWGRKNRALDDRTCPNCGRRFRPTCSKSKYCSRQCMWANNGGHNRKPESWWVNGRGYLEGSIWVGPTKKIHVKKHRLVMERHIGRALRADEDVHHKDGNKLNNDISNLELISHGAHSTHHNNRRCYRRGYRLNLTPAERRARSVRMKEMRRKALSPRTATVRRRKAKRKEVGRQD